MNEAQVYLKGFLNHHVSEAVQGSLPNGQNSPQKVPFGLYAEQLSGSAFTAPREQNLKAWLYRIRPSVVHHPFQQKTHPSFTGSPWTGQPTPPDQLRWNPFPYPAKPTHFIDSLYCMSGNGEVGQAGSAIYMYACTKSMDTEFFYNADGEMLIVLQEGGLSVKTEAGVIQAEPLEIVVIPRGMKFQVALQSDRARGYVCENFGAPFRLPDLGPIGANGLAQPRDFLYPTAKFEDREGSFKLNAKFHGHFWESDIGHSPLDVVAWHGNYAPYKYNLKLFNTINTVSFDHPDPSIFTVLTSPGDRPGVANVDFVIFPPRWMVAEHTFRPPYYHRNYMNEFMGLIMGSYDAKAEGFQPGGSSLHNRMIGHGPDGPTYERASTRDLVPEKIESTMAFMFESSRVYETTAQAMGADFRDLSYQDCWQGLVKRFSLN